MYCNIKHYQGNVDFEFGRYSNNRLAIILTELKTGESVCVATVNIPDYSLEEDEIILKNWSENEGILDFFVDNGLVVNNGKKAPAGHVVGHVVRITDKLKAMTFISCVGGEC